MFLYDNFCPCFVLLVTLFFNFEGNFLEDYTNKSNLHIAITNSTGNVFEFDRYYIQNLC